MNIDFTFSSLRGAVQFDTEATFDSDFIKNSDLKSIYIDRFGSVIADESTYDLIEELKDRGEWEDISDVDTIDFEEEMTVRGYDYLEKGEIQDLAHKINIGKASIQDVYRFIEEKSGVLICK
jgi:hypothetical protein